MAVLRVMDRLVILMAVQNRNRESRIAFPKQHQIGLKDLSAFKLLQEVMRETELVSYMYEREMS